MTQQREAAQEYCARYGLVLDHIYSDEAEKATAVEKRDEFGAMMTTLRQRFPVIYDPAKRSQRAKEKPFGLLCWKSNRLGRDLIHTRHVKSDLRLRGITIVSLVSIFETGNPGLDALIESFGEGDIYYTFPVLESREKRRDDLSHKSKFDERTRQVSSLTFGSLWKEEMTFGRNEGPKPHFKKVISHENNATR